jgi:hypothetical protein
MIAATFAGLDVEKSRGGYTLVDPRNGTSLARLKPIPQSDRFELFYWSDMRGRWRTFGDLGRLRLTLERDLPGGNNLSHPEETVRPLFFDKVELRSWNYNGVGPLTRVPQPARKIIDGSRGSTGAVGRANSDHHPARAAGPGMKTVPIAPPSPAIRRSPGFVVN